MTRLVGTAFSGSPLTDVDADAPTWKRVIDNAIRDTAFVDDILDGDNSPPAGTTVDHSGYDGTTFYRGAPLGVPICNQVFPLSTYSLASSGSERIYALAFPFLLPAGETEVYVDLKMTAALPYAPDAAVLSASTMADVSRFEMDYESNGQYGALLPGLTGGTQYILVVEMGSGTSSDPYNFFEGLRVHFGRIGAPDASMLALAARRANATVTVPKTGVAPAAIIPSVTNIDSDLISDGHPIHAWLATRIAQNQNALAEYLTGVPAPGKSALTLADTSGAGAGLESTNPTTSAFHDHSQAGKANEPLIDFPIWAEAIGGVKTNGQVSGLTNWSAPGLKVNTQDRLCNVPLFIPDGPAAAGTSKLKVAVLACTPDHADFATFLAVPITIDLKVQCYDSGGTGQGQITQAFAAIGSTRFGLATATVVPYAADAYNLLTVDLDISSGKLGGTGSDFRVLGACAYLEP